VLTELPKKPIVIGVRVNLWGRRKSTRAYPESWSKRTNEAVGHCGKVPVCGSGICRMESLEYWVCAAEITLA